VINLPFSILHISIYSLGLLFPMLKAPDLWLAFNKC
jgi:hypothetical protein